MKLLLLLVTILFSQDIAIIKFNSNITQILNVEERDNNGRKYRTTQIQVPGEYANIRGYKIRILNAHVQDCFVVRWSPLLPSLDTLTVDDRTCTVYYQDICNTSTEKKIISVNTSSAMKNNYDVLGRKITNKRRIPHIHIFHK